MLFRDLAKEVKMKNKFLDLIREGKAPIGTFMNFSNPDFVECVALAGIDYIIIDTEHGPKEAETVVDLIRAAEFRGTTPFVRVKDSSRASILKMLDIGAHGLVIPNVRSVDEVKKIVEYGKYAPLGMRGINMPRASGYGSPQTMPTLKDYTEMANKETMLIPQCETVSCLENIEEIVNIEGVDGIFVGPFDLSQDMGMTADFSNPKFVKAIERVLKACKEAKKPVLIFAPNPEAGKEKLKEGFDSVTISIDSLVFINAYSEIVKAFKNPS